MPVNDVKTYRELVTSLKQDDTSEKLKSNPVLNCIFNHFNTDGEDGFSAEEWQNYQNFCAKLNLNYDAIGNKETNDSVIKYYNEQLQLLEKEANKLIEKANAISDADHFINFMDFLDKHQLEYSQVKTSDKTIKIDITPFESGILNAEGTEFTGETLKTVYIDGYEKLSKKEQKEFMDLYKKAYKQLQATNKIEQKLSQIQIEVDKVTAYLDMAENGEITTLGKQEYMDSAYNKYVATRQVSNPFLAQIQDLEAKRNKLHLKANKTIEDNQLLDQYCTQINLLYDASAKWSIKDAVSGNSTGENCFKPTFGITTQFPSGQSDIADGTVNASVGYDFKYSNNNIDVASNGSVSRDLSTIEEQSILDNDYVLGNNFNYTYGDFSAEQSINFARTVDNQNISLNTNFNYKQFGLQYQQENSWTKENDNSSTNHYTSHNVALDYKGFLHANGNINLANEEQKVGLYIDKNIPIVKKDKFNVSATPVFGTSYNIEAQSVSLNPQLGVQANYQAGAWNGNVSLNENYSRTIGQDGYRANNNSFMVTTQTNYKKFGLSANYSNILAPESKTHTYGMGLSYQNDKNNFSLEYSNSIELYDGQDRQNTRTASIKYTRTF